ncbi:uncharacterized protein LOC129322483 [Prosopis cineraria]|uniref:uncharacterized protein LOC129322483 n=1 Tax=Prosopis cineraria TaxID=364024 RepID=UPI00240FBEBB|nr:uncharacterized protein LOC129322483 [Prosopis cineraria]
MKFVYLRSVDFPCPVLDFHGESVFLSSSWICVPTPATTGLADLNLGMLESGLWIGLWIMFVCVYDCGLGGMEYGLCTGVECGPRVTTMILEVDLQCVKCYKKVKNVLCKFPRCGAIKSIEIVEPKEKKTTQQPEQQEEKKTTQQPEQQEEKKTKQQKDKPTPLPPTPPPSSRTCCVPCDEGRHDGPCFKPELIPHRTCCDPCHEGRRCGPCFQCCGPPKSLPPTTGKTCCASCNDARPGGPCFEDYCRPPPCYGGYFYAMPVYDSYGGGQPCYVSRCGQYVNEDNVTGCAIM